MTYIKVLVEPKEEVDVIDSVSTNPPFSKQQEPEMADLQRKSFDWHKYITIAGIMITIGLTFLFAIDKVAVFAEVDVIDSVSTNAPYSKPQEPEIADLQRKSFDFWKYILFCNPVTVAVVFLSGFWVVGVRAGTIKETNQLYFVLGMGLLSFVTISAVFTLLFLGIAETLTGITETLTSSIHASSEKFINFLEKVENLEIKYKKN